MPPFGDPTIEEYVDPTAAIDPSPTSLSDASLQSMLDTVITVQAAYGQILVDVLVEFRLCVLIWQVLGILLHLHLLMMSYDCPLAIRHKKGEFWSFEAALDCI